MVESIAQKKPSLVQLWYTWSAIGLDAAELPAGFRVRAASPEPEDPLYRQRMEQRDRYLRYSLPPGSDLLNTSPFPYTEKAAPICLAFIRTPDGERCLVHKVYTGKDGRGRDGAYFAHMLANLPTDFFSARDAMRFWRLFPFWGTSDIPAQEQGTELRALSLNLVNYTYTLDMQQLSEQQKLAANVVALEQRFNKVATEGSDAVDEHLRFLLSAYLLQLITIEEQKKEIARIEQELQEAQEKAAQKGLSRKELNERKAKVEEREGRLQLELYREPPRIFIAAPPDEVAYLIAGLTRLLPRQFLRDLTFSTYENDVLKLPFHIVGTCEPAVRLGQNGSAHTLLPPTCYDRGFVLNTYVGRDNKQHYTNIPLERDEKQYINMSPIRDEKQYISAFLIDIDSDKIANIQAYAHDMSDALKNALYTGTYSKRQGYEVPPDRLPPIPDADEIFTDEGIGDYPHIPLDELPDITVDDLLMVYSDGQLPLPENTRILSDPYTALGRLRRLRYRRQIFVRTYLTPNYAQENRKRNKERREEHLAWLENVLPALLNKLRAATLHIEPDKARELALHLDLLANLAADEVCEAALHQDLGRFLAIFAPLRALEPSPLRQPEPMSDIWAGVLERCCGNPLSLQFIQTHEMVRQMLLIVALEVLGPAEMPSLSLLHVLPTTFGGQKLLKFLYDTIQPERLARLLNVRQTVPHQLNADYIAAKYEEKKTMWFHQALLCFFNTGRLVQNEVGIQWYNYIQKTEVIATLETDAILLEDLVTRLLKSSHIVRRQSPPTFYQQWYQNARMLYHTLKYNGYDPQLSLKLYKLFWDDNDEPIKPDYKAFTPEKMEAFLTTYGSARLHQEGGWRWVAPLFWLMVEQEKGAERNTRVLFVLLDGNQSAMPLSKENFAGLLDAANVVSNFAAKDMHSFFMHHSKVYARDIISSLMKHYAVPLHKTHVQSLLLAHFNPEIHQQWMKVSPLYSNRIYRLPLRYAQDHPQELHIELLNSPYYMPYLEELHDLFIHLSDDYEKEVHKVLMKSYPDQYNGEAHQLFMNYIAQRRENKDAVLKLFSTYYAAHTEKVHELLVRHVTRHHEHALELLKQRFTDLIKHEFLEYLQEDEWEVYLLQLYGLEQYEQVVHQLLINYCKPMYEETYKRLRALSPSVNQHAHRGQKVSPDYLQLYPDLPLWVALIKLLQAASHAGKMPLVRAYIQARHDFKGAEKLAEGSKQARMFLESAKLSKDEYYEVMYRSGPDMQDVGTLSPLIVSYYGNNNTQRDFALLCRQLDKHPNDLLANDFLEKTGVEVSKVDDYLSRYAQHFPQFCYRLPAAQPFYAQAGWHKIQPYLSVWLSKGMSETDLQTIGAYIPSGIRDDALLEEYASSSYYLGSKLFIQLTRQYLENPDIKLLQRERGRQLVDLLFQNRSSLLYTHGLATLHENLEALHTLLDFLRNPATQQERLSQVFKLIHQKKWAQSSSTLGARALISCIKYRIEPGYVYVLISQNKEELAKQCMEDMVRRVVIQIEARPSGKLVPWQHHLALLFESSLLLGQDVLIESLLNVAASSTESYIYLQKQSAFWSPKQQSRARGYGLVTQPHEWPWSPFSQLPEPELPNGEQEISLPEKMPIVFGILKIFLAWLHLPLLLLRLRKLCAQQKQGTGKLARFWLEYGDTCVFWGGWTRYQWKQKLQFACAFHNACLDMLASPPPIEASQTLLAIVKVEAQEEQSYLPNLTDDERRLVQKAAKSVGWKEEDYPPYLVDLLYGIERGAIYE